MNDIMNDTKHKIKEFYKSLRNIQGFPPNVLEEMETEIKTLNFFLDNYNEKRVKYSFENLQRLLSKAQDEVQ